MVEISDDKVMDILIDTQTKVSVIADGFKKHVLGTDELHKKHDIRLTRLEHKVNVEPVTRNTKYWAKRLAPWTAGLSMVGYVFYDVWTKIKGG